LFTEEYRTVAVTFFERPKTKRPPNP